MAKNCVITLDPAVVDKAAANAKRLGTNLKGVIEGTITQLAAETVQDGWITERELVKEPGMPSRVALWNMRTAGKLVEGKHYKRGGRNGRFIYYWPEAVREALANRSNKTDKTIVQGRVYEVPENLLQT